jgi:hypothetical protein
MSKPNRIQKLLAQRSLAIICGSILVGLASRFLLFMDPRVREAAGAGSGARLTCEAVVLLIPLFLAAALARPLGASARTEYPLAVQVAAAAWFVWALLMAVGTAAGAISLKQGAVEGVLAIAVNFLSLVALIGFAFGFWLSLGTIVLLGIQLGRRAHLHRPQS